MGFGFLFYYAVDKNLAIAVPDRLDDPTSRSARPPSRNGLYSDDRFLVEETNRQIGWSCYPLKNPACQVTEEGECGELKKVTTMEIRPINCQDKKKGKSCCMQEKSSQIICREALGGRHEAQDNEGIEPCVSTSYRKDGNGSSLAVNFDIAQPFASSELGVEQPYKKKKQTYQLQTEKTKDKMEDAIPEKNMEPGMTSEQDVEYESGSKSNRTICCPTNCECFIPPDNEGFEEHRLYEVMILEDNTLERSESPIWERKKKEDHQSGDANWSNEMFVGNQAFKKKRPSMTGEHTTNKNNRMGKTLVVQTSCIILEFVIFRIGKIFPSFPIIPRTGSSSKEEMEVSSFPAPAEGTAREAPEKVLNDWPSIMAAAHRLLGCSSYRPIRPHVRENSSANSANNGESVTEIQSANEKNKKSLLEPENPSQTMVIEQGSGNAGNQIFDLFSISRVKGNCSGTAGLNTKGRIVSSSSCKGNTKGKSKNGKAETRVKIVGWKERTDVSVGSSRRGRSDGSSGMKSKEMPEDPSGSSIKKKVKTRSLTSIYDDIRSRLPTSSMSKGEEFSE